MGVIIVGGGIGGLTTALALHARGIKAVVCEQSAQFRQLGVGINTLPHAIKELAGLGLLGALDSIGIRTSTLIYKTAAGQDILSQPRGTGAGYDVPQFSIHRGKLQQVLLDAARDRLGPDAILTGHRLTGFEQTEAGVTARFDHGGKAVTLTGEGLIGADGIHSTVRKHYRGDEGVPRWNGILMWRGATWWPPFADGRTMIIAGGMKAKLVLYPIFNSPDHPGKTLMNWVVCAQLGDASTPLPTREDWSKPGSAEDALSHVRGVFDLPEVDVEGLITATQENYVYPMCDRHDAPNALAAYEDARRPATSAIVTANRGGGPERVIDLVEARAPDGFDDLHDVATPEELTALVGDYQAMAGFAQDQVNR